MSYPFGCMTRSQTFNSHLFHSQTFKIKYFKKIFDETNKILSIKCLKIFKDDKLIFYK